MTTSLQPAKSLEDRITARLHESIGDLITDEDLKGMVARGIEQALFTERHDEKNSDQWHKRTKPSVVDEQVAKLLGEKMQSAVDQWLKANPDKIQAAIDITIKAGVADALLRTLDNRFAGVFDSGVATLQSRGLLPR